MKPPKDLAAPALKDSRLHLAEPPQVPGGKARSQGRGGDTEVGEGPPLGSSLGPIGTTAYASSASFIPAQVLAALQGETE